MRDLSLIAASGAACLMALLPLPAVAEDEGAIPPVRIGDLESFSVAETMAYALGVLQTMTYLTAKTSEDYDLAACIAGQERLAYQTLTVGEEDGPAALAIEIAVMDACESGANESTGGLLGADDAEEWFGGGRPGRERAMFVLGLSDTLYFRVFTRVEDAVAECVHELSQVAMSPDNDFSRQILEAPSDPLVRPLIDKPIEVCLE